MSATSATITRSAVIAPAVIESSGIVAGYTTASPRVAPPALPAPTACTVEELRAAVAAVDSTTSYSTAAASTLHAQLLSRYAFHAARYAVTVEGVPVLPEGDRREVAALVWLDATTRTTPPAAADRTPAQSSIGSYVARFGTVATDLAHGTDYLTGTDSAADAYKAINEAKAAAKAAADARKLKAEGQASHAAFMGWLANESQPVREAFALVTATLVTTAASVHAPAFALNVAHGIAESK